MFECEGLWRSNCQNGIKHASDLLEKMPMMENGKNPGRSPKELAGYSKGLISVKSGKGMRLDGTS